jgi:hypothetical protein
MNEQQAVAAPLEIPELHRHSDSGRQSAAASHLAATLERCATSPGSCLWFVGD